MMTRSAVARHSPLRHTSDTSGFAACLFEVAGSGGIAWRSLAFIISEAFGGTSDPALLVEG